MKRVFDLLVAGAALVALAPVFLIIAALVFLDSGLPIFFVQRRVGRDMAPFDIFKFRSMRRAAGPLLTVGGDRRVTRVGRFLRAIKLDELPQLWNVVMGDMSLVGPRPEVEYYVALYPARFRKVLQVRPGVTDAASILLRDEESVLAAAADPMAMYANVLLPVKLDLAEAYVKYRSLGGDIQILFETVAACLGKRFRGNCLDDSWKLAAKIAGGNRPQALVSQQETETPWPAVEFSEKR